VHFTASAQLARHNNLVRALGGKAVEKRKLLPLAAIYSYLQRFQEPHLEEGFEEIVRVDFVFRGTEEEREVWSLWWD
jgi:bifunctional polynucleotide phosphatase/kinase